MDEDLARRIYFKARRVACDLGFPRYQEDLAQEAVLIYLETKTRGKLVEFAVIDAIRRIFGDSRKKFKKPDTLSFDILSPAEQDHAVQPVFSEMPFKGLEKKKRAMLLLSAVWGFSNEEIGQLFGYTPITVQHQLSVLKTALRKRWAKDQEK
jgi:DNA-directed RNA polymerase specialized sigma24 family protein